MTDEIKRRTIIDLSPDDVSNSYTDSTFNAGTTTLDNITGQDTTTFNSNAAFHPGAAGGRTVPNDAGYAYSDTPEATVFVQKRQWVEDDWTYVTNSKERPGKVQELLLRIRIGNLITRKLDWLNDHEVFTKVSKLNSLITSNALDLSGSQVTRYYTETLDLSEQKTTTTEVKIEKTETLTIATKVVVNTVDSGQGGRLLVKSTPEYGSHNIITGIHGKNTGGPSTRVELITTGKGSNEAIIKNVINGPNSVVDGKPGEAVPYPQAVKSNPQLLKKYPSAEWWEIELSSIRSEDIYPDASRDKIFSDMPDKKTATRKQLQEYARQAISKGYAGGKGYVARVPQGRLPARQLSYADGPVIEVSVVTGTETEKKTETSPKITRIYHNVFNGVIELANIASISTTISNSGSQGSAQLTLQNPNNILTISDEDIDIALGLNPFLEGTRNEFGESPQDIVAYDDITGQKRQYKYYRGRYYTDRAYELAVRQDLGAIGNITNTKQIEDLKNVIDTLTQGIQRLQSFRSNGLLSAATWQYLKADNIKQLAPTEDKILLAAIAKKFSLRNIEIHKAFVVTVGTDQKSKDEPIGTYLRYAEVSAQVRNKIRKFANIILLARKRIEDSISSGTIVVKNKDTDLEAAIRNQIKRYFQNRTVFQVLDRIFIWMTSPSRTEHTLPNGAPVAEEFTIGANRVRRIQEIISLIQQTENVIQSIATQLKQYVPPAFSDTDLAIINQQLYATGSSEQLTTIFKNIEEALGGAVFAKDGKTKKKGKLPPLIKILQDSIKQKMKELTIVVKDADKAAKMPVSTDTAVQGVDPSKLFAPNSYIGLTDRQFQVFQGVITSISRSYSNGTFTIRLNCADNLHFLQRSRYINIPSQGQYLNRARPILDDPIWRQKDAFLTKTLQVGNKTVPVESFFGKWKAGQLTLTTKILDPKAAAANATDTSQKKETTNTDNVTDQETINRAFGRAPQSENEPFEGADPASIISVLTCGVPFDLAVYLENVIFKGSLAVEPNIKSTPGTPHSGEVLQIGPFEQLRQEIEPMTKKYGGFQPYLLLESAVTDKDRAASNIATKINLAVAIMSFYKNYIAARKSVLATDVVKDQQKTDTPGSPFKQITEKNVDQIIPGDFPASSAQIKLGAFQGQIDRKVVFIITAALNRLDASRVNKALSTGAFIAEEFKIGSEDFGPAFQSVPNRAIFGLTGAEFGLYLAIRQAASDRVSRGAVFRILLDKEPPKKNYSTPQSPSMETLVGANINNPSSKSLKAQRDARLHPTNILQATKESIIYKVKPNFLVVSSQYFLSPKLTDYVRLKGNPGGQFNENQYAVVLDRCIKAAKTIDWEFYADSQGHLQFKPPTYNRTLLHHLIDFDNMNPLTLKQLVITLDTYKALDSIKARPLAKYKQVFSSIKQAYKDMIQNQLDQMKGIKLLTGPGDLVSVSSLLGLGSSEPTSLLQLVITKHITKERLPLIAALLQSGPTAAVSIQPKNNPRKAEIEKELAPANISKALEQLMKAIKQDVAPTIFPELADEQANAIMAKQLAEFETAKEKYYAPAKAAAANKKAYNATDSENDAFAKAGADVIEVAINLVVQAQKNLDAINQEIAKIEKDVDSAIKHYVDPDKIHIITSAILISEDWEENKPDFTRLNATGAFSFSLPEDPKTQFLTWAGSVDYDLWRMYGYEEESIQIPFLQDPSTIALYCDLLMARQYSKILRGSITVRGDSKYQLGDCVYIEDENLYYYITSVNHQFTYGQSFNTILTLEYGRRPGNMIPYPFSILGENFARGANVLYTNSGGEKISGTADLNKLLDASYEKAQELYKKPETNN